MSRAPLRVLLAFTVLLSAASAQIANTTVTFSNEASYGGDADLGVVSGDFDLDGLPDLALLAAPNFVQIFHNLGAGMFTPVFQTTIGMNPVQMVVGRFTTSGRLDLAVVSADKTLTFLFGNNFGTFGNAVSFTLSGVPMAMIAADLGNDGFTRLAIVECAGAHNNECSLNLYSYRNALYREQTIPLPEAPVFNGLIAADDFNLDNKTDIAVATATKVLVFTNQTDFTRFGQAARLALASTITPPNTASIVGLAAGHFNNDAAPDLAIEVFDNTLDTSSPNSDYIFQNTGAGDFFLRSKVPGTEGFGHVLAVSDINGDGIEDLIQVGTSFHNGDVTYSLGNGDGTFLAPQPVTAFPGGVNTAVIARDLNLNSRHDLAVTSIGAFGTSAFISVLLNQSAATNCLPPSSALLTAKICAATAAPGRTIAVSASGNSPAGIKRTELWIDSVKRAQAFSDQLRARVAVSPGTHEVVIVAVDVGGYFSRQVTTVNVP